MIHTLIFSILFDMMKTPMKRKRWFMYRMKLKRNCKKWILYASTFIWSISLLHLSYMPASTSAITPPAPTGKPTLTLKQEDIITPEPSPEVSPTPTPTPIPAALTTEIEQSTNINIIDPVSAYLHAQYANDITTLQTLVSNPENLSTSYIENVSKDVSSISNLVCYTKPGLHEIDVIVYACFDVKYKSSANTSPCLEELYLIKLPDGSYQVYTATLSNETKQQLLLARQTEDVMTLSIESLITRYYNARLSYDPVRIRSCISISNEDMEIMFEKVKHIEEYRNITCYIHPGINEFDYIVYVSFDIKIVSIDTPGPSLDEIYIAINPISGKPYIYHGHISEESAEYAYKLRTSDESVALKNSIEERLKEAVLSDDLLYEYVNKLVNASGQSQ